MEENKVLLSDYLLACVHFDKDPTPENEQAIADILAKIEVSEYVDFKYKEIAVGSIVSSLPEGFDAIASAGQLQISKLFYGILPYARNLINDMSIVAFTFGVVDMIYKYGLYDTIFGYCEDDYKRLEKMVDDCLNLGNVTKLFESLQLLDTTEFDKWLKTMKEMKTELTPEMIHDMATIMGGQPGGVSDLEHSLQRDALEDAGVKVEQKAEAIDELIEKQAEKKEA